MPTDAIRPPQKFPEYFHFTLEQGLGSHLMVIKDTKSEAESIARKYRAFLRSLKQYPLHPLHKKIKYFDVRTRKAQLPNKKWALYIDVKQKINWASCLMPPENWP